MYDRDAGRPLLPRRADLTEGAHGLGAPVDREDRGRVVRHAEHPAAEQHRRDPLGRVRAEARVQRRPQKPTNPSLE